MMTQGISIAQIVKFGEGILQEAKRNTGINVSKGVS